VRYGMNPHQAASIVAGHGPRVINGEPSMINFLDALNAFQLVREADEATGQPAAASFKHVSPAGAALAGPVDVTAARLWRVAETADGGLLSAYVRARDADPKSSFGDVAALSRSVDRPSAEFLRTVICDAVIAPGFEPGTAAILAAKRGGRFLVLEADPERVPPPVERRDVLGVTIEQERDQVPVKTMLPNGGVLDPATRADALLGLVTLRYTQSNSVALIRAGAAIGVGAGQQNRVDCVRLAGAKARTWWLRRHPFTSELPEVSGMPRQDRLNWQIRFAGQEMTPAQLTEFTSLFGAEASRRYTDAHWRDQWTAELSDVTLTSDGYLPFRDNVEHAAAAHGITHVPTGVRLFHH
jgi:phosphoribosylaminoimidazolecarboxamide formyltransferase / IMP cyclohydrolase